MSTPPLVRAFYERIWNAGDLEAADGLLASGLSFRGALGAEHAELRPDTNTRPSK